MLNIERLTILAETLEAMPADQGRFKMAHWVKLGPDQAHGEFSIAVKNINACGTAACLAGHAAIMFGDPDKPLWDERSGSFPRKTAKDVLGLTEVQATNLFQDLRAMSITDPKVGAKAVRNLIADPSANPWNGVL